jgi:hypothetical protein
MHKYESCTSCASTASPQGAKFCSNCGARLISMNSTEAPEPEVPMAPAVPVYDDIPSHPAAPVEEVQYSTPSRGQGYDPFVASAITMPPMTEDEVMASAVYWKNPSPAMLESAKTQAVAGVFGIETSSLKGKFTVPERIQVGQVFNGCKIDMSVADFVHPVTYITGGAVFGGASLIVPKGVRVESHGVGIFGSFGSLKHGQTVHAGQVADSPLVVIKGAAIFGSVSVKVNEYAPPIRVVP